jgi:hypothetical protein
MPNNGEGRLLLTDGMLEHVRKNLDGVIFYQASTDSLVRGYLHHSGGCTPVLFHDDAEQADYDLDTCSGFVLERLAQCEEFEEQNPEDFQ